MQAPRGTYLRKLRTNGVPFRIQLRGKTAIGGSLLSKEKPKATALSGKGPIFRIANGGGRLVFLAPGLAWHWPDGGGGLEPLYLEVSPPKKMLGTWMQAVTQDVPERRTLKIGTQSLALANFGDFDEEHQQVTFVEAAPDRWFAIVMSKCDDEIPNCERSLRDLHELRWVAP
jgi:hypothetical protein